MTTGKYFTKVVSCILLDTLHYAHTKIDIFFKKKQPGAG